MFIPLTLTEYCDLSNIDVEDEEEITTLDLNNLISTQKPSINMEEIIHRNSAGQVHREDGPAIVRPYGSKEWWINGKRHRLDGPAVIRSDNHQEWWVEGKKHREGGPAKIDGAGTKFWYINDRLHREDGPAIEYFDGSCIYFLDGRKHRVDGPAELIKNPDGTFTQNWYFKGDKVSENDIPNLIAREKMRHERKKMGRKSWVDSWRGSDDISSIQSNTDTKSNSTSTSPKNPKPFNEWRDEFGRLHRVDGPALVLEDGSVKWYWSGTEVTEEQHRVYVAENNKSLQSSTQNQNSASKETKTDTPNKSESVKPDKLKQWPENPSSVLEFDEIWKPLKDILEAGYSPIRPNGTKTFNYVGFDLGKIEKGLFPPLDKQFTEKYLADQKSKNKSLMDTVMRAMFHMGMEQCRRMNYQEHQSTQGLKKTIEELKTQNRKYKSELNKTKIALNIREQYPNLSEEQFKATFRREVEKNRKALVEELKKDLLAMSDRPAFSSLSKKKNKLADLIAIANSLDPNLVKLEDWKNILKTANLNLSDWQKYCKKHKFDKFKFVQ